MKVSELIEYLKTQDQDATVEVLQGYRGSGYSGDGYRKVDFDPERHAEYTDFRGNPYCKGQPYENGRFLFLGECD